MSAGEAEHEHTITREEFRELTRELLGLSVTKPWRGYGSAFFLELGELSPGPVIRGTETGPFGEASVGIEWSWRIERPRSVLCGSWSGERKMNSCIERLAGREVLDVEVEGRIPEIEVALSGGLWVHSFQTYEGQPAWGITLREKIIAVSGGRLVCSSREDGRPGSQSIGGLGRPSDAARTP